MRRDAQIERNRAQLIVASSINSIHMTAKVNRAQPLVIEEFFVSGTRTRSSLVSTCCNARVIPPFGGSVRLLIANTIVDLFSTVTIIERNEASVAELKEEKSLVGELIT